MSIPPRPKIACGLEEFLEQVKSISEEHNAPAMLIVIVPEYEQEGGTDTQSIRFYKLSKTKSKRGRLTPLESSRYEVLLQAEKLFKKTFYVDLILDIDNFGDIYERMYSEAILMLYARGTLKMNIIDYHKLYSFDMWRRVDRLEQSLVFKPEYNDSWRSYLNHMQAITIVDDLII